jgi:hypothetical protein
MSNTNEPSPASMELTSRLAEMIGADPALTQSIRIDVNVHREPTVTVTRLVDADQVGRIIKTSTWSDFTLVKNDELKRLRKGTALTDAEREAVAYFATFHGSPREADAKHGKTLHAMLERMSPPAT